MDRKKRHLILLTEEESLHAETVSVFAGHYHITHTHGPVPTSADLLLIDGRLNRERLAQCATLLNVRTELPVVIIGPATAWRHISTGRLLEGFVDGAKPAVTLIERVTDLLERGDFLRGQSFIGPSSTMQELRERILQIAPTPVTILITGETGTGKEDVARALHRFSSRSADPFRPLNCAAIPDNLLEDALFGHEKGAFTDARSKSRGVFEQAHGGTVFLDEIGEMPAMAQVSLLRVLESQEVTRIGGENPIAIDTRVIAATNRNLRQAVAQGTFRLDLYHRLKIVELTLTSLRRRPEDVPPLLEHFTSLLTTADTTPRFTGFSSDAVNLLQQYDWPGNVRELRNMVERLAYVGPKGEIQPDELIPHLESAPPTPTTKLPVATNKTPDQSERELIYMALLDLKRDVADLRHLIEIQPASSEPPRAAAPSSPLFRVEDTELEPTATSDTEPPIPKTVSRVLTLKEQQKESIEEALRQVGGNRQQAAQMLGLSVRTLYRKLDEYGLRSTT